MRRFQLFLTDFVWSIALGTSVHSLDQSVRSLVPFDLHSPSCASSTHVCTSSVFALTRRVLVQLPLETTITSALPSQQVSQPLKQQHPRYPYYPHERMVAITMAELGLCATIRRTPGAISSRHYYSAAFSEECLQAEEPGEHAARYLLSGIAGLVCCSLASCSSSSKAS